MPACLTEAVRSRRRVVQADLLPVQDVAHQSQQMRISVLFAERICDIILLPIRGGRKVIRRGDCSPPFFYAQKML